ncbi:MAG: type II toxin-antitoxin system Phd/YefM family antitoxin [Xanthobacteraceae bacterium]
MEEPVSAADANRKFSQLLRAVRAGRSYVVTSHGKPVARIVPVDRHDDLIAGARRALLARLRSEPVTDIGRWRRDELYEDFAC